MMDMIYGLAFMSVWTPIIVTYINGDFERWIASLLTKRDKAE